MGVCHLCIPKSIHRLWVAEIKGPQNPPPSNPTATISNDQLSSHEVSRSPMDGSWFLMWTVSRASSQHLLQLYAESEPHKGVSCLGLTLEHTGQQAGFPPWSPPTTR